MTKDEAQQYIFSTQHEWAEPVFKAFNKVVEESRGWDKTSKSDIDAVLKYGIEYDREELANLEVGEFSEEDMYNKVHYAAWGYFCF